MEAPPNEYQRNTLLALLDVCTLLSAFYYVVIILPYEFRHYSAMCSAFTTLIKEQENTVFTSFNFVHLLNWLAIDL